MPFKRKYPMRRRRRPFFKKRIFKRRIPRQLNSRKPYLFRQEYSVQNLGWPAGATPGTTPGISYSFRIDGLSQFNSFQTVFDEYKISAIKFKYSPTNNTSTPGEPTYLIHSVIDYDDSVPLASINDSLQYQNHKVYPGTRSWSRYFKPRFTMAALTTQSGSPAGTSRRGWLDCSDTSASVAHYGIKIFADYPVPLTSIQHAQIYVVLYLMFRNVR